MSHDADLHVPTEATSLNTTATARQERRDAARHRHQVLLTAARLFAERCWNEGAIGRWTVSEAEGVCLCNCNTPEEWRAAQGGPRTPAG